MTHTFDSLGLSDPRVRQLAKLGFTTPTPIQAQTIPPLLEGRDIIGQAQTGTGKTAAFALPILERISMESHAVQALILAPTRELAMQVSQAIHTYKGDSGLRTLAVYGGQPIERQISRLQKGVQVLVGTPGRILDLLRRGVLKLDQLRWFVLDEADEMLNMGFIGDVETILSQTSPKRQTAFFSATMPSSIRRLSTKFLRSPLTVAVEQPKAAPKQIHQVGYRIGRSADKPIVLQQILELEDPESALIFVRTRRTAARLTSQLQAAGYSADEYHGDLNQSQRERLMNRFRQQQIRWVVATDIAARGLHVEDLSHVINYDLPETAEGYVHRIGRTGRAGKPGIAISLVHALDRRKLRSIENHVRQTISLQTPPTQAEIESRRLTRLQEQVRAALMGERMASFLPLVAELNDDYDSHAIAAAALQLLYDQTRSIGSTSSATPPVQESRPASRSGRSAAPKGSKPSLSSGRRNQ